MKISIIVPVYNVEDYLQECIESVLSQTYQNFELILVNDGSTDDSGLICDQYVAHYLSKIKVIHKKNGGLVQARIEGILKATGDVMVFLDSDDTICRDAIECIANSFKKTNCDMLIYNAEKTTLYPSKAVHHPFENGQCFCSESKAEIYLKLILGDLPNSIWLKAVRSECTVFPPSYMNYRVINGEDLLFTACFLTNCTKIVCIDKGLYHYRIRQGSAVNSFNINRKESIKIVHTELGKYIDQWNIPELKPLHATRKVRGWIDQLKLLLKNKKHMDAKSFKSELNSMAEDPYFRNAYSDMEQSLDSCYDRVLARCLYKRQYFLIRILHVAKMVVRKVKFHVK